MLINLTMIGLINKSNQQSICASHALMIYANPAFWGSIPDTASMLLGQESNPGGPWLSSKGYPRQCVCLMAEQSEWILDKVEAMEVRG